MSAEDQLYEDGRKMCWCVIRICDAASSVARGADAAAVDVAVTELRELVSQIDAAELVIDPDDLQAVEMSERMERVFKRGHFVRDLCRGGVLLRLLKACTHATRETIHAPSMELRYRVKPGNRVCFPRKGGGVYTRPWPGVAKVAHIVQRAGVYKVCRSDFD